MQTVVNVLVEIGVNGRPVYEELLVELEAGHHRIVRSPGLVLGVAAGDVIELAADGSYRLVSRGRNLCIQIFTKTTINTENVDRFNTPKVTAVGGTLDGKSGKELVYTIPVEVGFEVVETIMREMIKVFPDVEWFYGNVYDPKDGVTPLDWWRTQTVVS